MTRFEQCPGEDYFHMESLVNRPTADTLRNIGALGGTNITEAVRLAVSSHKVYTDTVAQGDMLFVDDGGAVKPLTLPPEITPGSDEVFVAINLNVSASVKNYLEPRTAPDNSLDLVGFWESATKLYGQFQEIDLLGHSLFRVSPRKKHKTPRLQELILKSIFLDS